MGATYRVKHKLSKQEQNELFAKLAKTFALLHNSAEMANFLRDLLSEAEVFMLSRRLQIAELLIEGLTYDKICSALKVGPSTIARVQTWLELYGDGYRNAVKKINKTERATDDSTKPFARFKRKYPMYFWPELLLKEIIKTANQREKQRLLKVVEQLRDKTQLSKELQKLLR